MDKIQQRIHSAILNTQEAVPGYFEKTCSQRLAATGCGSILEDGIKTMEDIQRALTSANWVEFHHHDLIPGTTAFKTSDIVGRLGVVSLDGMNDESVVTLDDRKNTGKVSCTIKGTLGPKVDHTVIILGDEGGKEVVFTFHPGDPVRASQVTCEPGMHGQERTVRQAREMGLTTAKIVA